MHRANIAHLKNVAFWAFYSRFSLATFWSLLSAVSSACVRRSGGHIGTVSAAVRLWWYDWVWSLLRRYSACVRRGGGHMGTMRAPMRPRWYVWVWSLLRRSSVCVRRGGGHMDAVIPRSTVRAAMRPRWYDLRVARRRRQALAASPIDGKGLKLVPQIDVYVVIYVCKALRATLKPKRKGVLL